MAPHLDAAIDAFESHMDATYSVAWIDCLARGPARGRSLISLGEHARADDPKRPTGNPFRPRRPRPRRMPLDAPSWALGRLSGATFNQVYFRAGRRAPAESLVDWDSYFYPLDAVRDWNRIYGARGFSQYQCVLPLEASRQGLNRLLETISTARLGAFLSVLKRFGPGAPDRPLSFPMEGYTLALDFPLTGTALSLMDELDAITLDHGGRLYLAKDARMTQSTFEAGYGTGLETFRTRRDRRFGSLQSRRLGL